MKIKRISLIEPEPKKKSIWSIVKQPRLGAVILATILKDRGYEVKVFCEAIKEIDWNYVYSSDLVGVSFLTQTANEAYKIGRKVKKNNIPLLFGGPHATILPEDAVKHCDIVVRGEGEKTFLTLLRFLEEGKNLKGVNGISFKKNKVVVHNRPLSEIVDLDELPSPDLSLIHGYEEQPKRSLFHPHIRTGVISTSRGCPYNCEFCSVVKLFGRKWRVRSVKKVIQDIKKHLEIRKPDSIFFIDDNFIVNKERTIELLNEIIRGDFDVPFSCQIRADSACDEEIVKLMKKAGIDLVYIGFESINQKTLENYNKNTNIEKTVRAIKNLKKHGIYIHGMFVFGSDYDTKKSVSDTLKFCFKHNIDTIQFFPLTALPGTRLTERLKKEKRVIKIPWEYFDVQHANVFFKSVRPSTLQKEILKAYKKFYSWKRIVEQMLKRNKYTFYCALFGKLFLLPKTKKDFGSYIKFLKKIEIGKYKGEDLEND